MFLSLHQLKNHFFAYIFVIVVVQKEMKPGCLLFFSNYNMNKNLKTKKIDILHLVFSHQLIEQNQKLSLGNKEGN
jgi:hypothetical protein